MEDKRHKQQIEFIRGDKVLYVQDRRVYDFGYISQTGHAIIYEEGECNMQDASAVDMRDLIKIVQD
jgi:hypothetical protein